MKYYFFVAFAYLIGMPCLQAQLNAYAYVVVPKKLQDFEQENQYHSSTLLKYLLTQNDFTAYYEGEPTGDVDDICKGLVINLLDESTMLRTKVFLILRDCHGTEVFRSMEGSSRLKVVKDAYEEAIRMAFRSIAALDYHYEAPKKQDSPAAAAHEEAKKMDKTEKQVAARPEGADNPAVIVKATPEEQLYADKRPVPSAYSAALATALPASEAAAVPDNVEVLYAQVLPDGYQLVDRSPKIKLVLKKTSLPEVYLAENDDSHGLVYRDGSQWYYECYRNGSLVVEELHIRF